jgi:hypothetical protein
VLVCWDFDLAARDKEQEAIPLEYLWYPVGACWSRARAVAAGCVELVEVVRLALGSG